MSDETKRTAPRRIDGKARIRLVAEGDTGELLAGDELLSEIGELLRERLSRVPLDDPFRPALYALACAAGVQV